MKKILGVFVLATFSVSVAAAVAGMEEAKEVASSFNAMDFIGSTSAENVPGFGSDVSELTGLFSKGQGNLLIPGTSKAEDCLSENSPDCQAVQMIYETNANPGYPEKDLEGIVDDRDQLLGNLGERPPQADVGGSGTVCETVTTTHPPLTDYAVCEETAAGTSTQTCIAGWVEKLDISTLFSCIARTGLKTTLSCSADYVNTSQKYTCTQAPEQTCTMGSNVSVDSTYLYGCKTQKFSQKTYRCNKVLAVVGYPGCEPGKFQQASTADHSGLGKDDCNGGDTLELKYRCSTDEVPTIRIETNVKNAANFGFEVNALNFHEDRKFSNGCRGVWTGTTRCTGVNCITTVKADMYVPDGSYSGSLRKEFAYQTYSHSGERDKWITTCVDAEGKTVEAPQ